MTFRLPVRRAIRLFHLALFVFIATPPTLRAQMSFSVWGHSYTVQAPPTPTSRAVCGNSWCGSAPPVRQYCPSCIAAMQAQAAARQAAHDAARVAAAQRKQQQNAYKLATKAVAASHRGDWATTLDLFRQSYRLNPTAETLNNIRTAILHTIQIQGNAALDEDNASIGRELAKDTQQLDSGASSIAAQLQQLDTSMRNATAIPATGGSDLFSTRSRFAMPLPALVTTSLPVVNVNSALQQLSSINASSTAAASVAKDSSTSLNDAEIEIAKALSGCGFDGAPCAAAQNLIYPHPVQTPAAAALEERIPPAQRNDPQIQQRLHEFDHFQAHLAEKQMQIAEVTRSIQAGGADTAALKAYRADLQHQATQDKQSSDQTLSFLHMHVPTIGAPASLTGPQPPTTHP